jgi:hypothetical protein
MILRCIAGPSSLFLRQFFGVALGYRFSHHPGAPYLTLLQEEVNHIATERNFVRAQVNICDSGRLGMTPALKGSAADAQKIANFLGSH